MDAVVAFARGRAGRDVTEPPAFRAAVDQIARSGGTPLAIAEDGRLLGVIHLKDVVKADMKEQFAELRRIGNQDRDDHGRQPGDCGRDRVGGRRGRFHCRSDARGQASLHSR